MRHRPIVTLMLLAVLVEISARTAVPEDPASDYRLANQALQGLLASPLGHTLPRLPWKIQILQSWGVNAYSNGG